MEVLQYDTKREEVICRFSTIDSYRALNKNIHFYWIIKLIVSNIY